MLKKSIFIFLFAALVCAALSAAENVPQPVGWVNDFAGVISQEYRDKLSGLIGELEEKAGAEVAVVTVTSIAPYDERSYVRMLFDSWKPGKKGKDNGVLILLAVKERRWRIEAGYGVEGILPDGLCGEIGRNYMVPSFKAGEYGKGLYNGAAVIAGIIAKDAGVTLSLSAENAELQTKGGIPNDKIIYVIFILIFILFTYLPLIMRYRRGYYSSGGWGSGSSGGWGGGFGGGGFGGGGFGGGGGGGGGAGGGF
jgi:uncharacterized protein